MKINKKAWHSKVWLWTHKVVSDVKYAPEQTNLCNYVQRIFWLTPWCVFWMLVITLLYIVATPIAFLFGGRPQNILFPLDKKKSLWLPYPGLKVWGEVRVHPWEVVIPATIIYLEYLWFKHCAWYWPVGVQGGIILLIAMVVLWGVYDSSETKEVINEWVSAKKSGICPLVEFTDEE